MEVVVPPDFQPEIHLCGPTQENQSSTSPLSHNQHSLQPVLTLRMNVMPCGELNSEATHLQTNTLWQLGLQFSQPQDLSGEWQ